VGPPHLTLRMRSHWWWRPGWRPGRRQYAWHLTFGDQTVSPGQADLRQVMGGYQARLAEPPGLDPVPAEWLHLTVQGIGFADEIDTAEVDRIVAAARRRCAALAPVRVTLGSILETPASMVTLALKSALFPKNMLSTRLPAALK
jgi:hypothetical protein